MKGASSEWGFVAAVTRCAWGARAMLQHIVASHLVPRGFWAAAQCPNHGCSEEDDSYGRTCTLLYSLLLQSLAVICHSPGGSVLTQRQELWQRNTAALAAVGARLALGQMYWYQLHP